MRPRLSRQKLTAATSGNRSAHCVLFSSISTSTTMSSTTASHSASPEVLLGILSTLQRLEALLQNHNHRLNAIEKSSHPDLETSRLEQESDDPIRAPSPSQYAHSVLRLQRFFNLDSRSGLNLYDQAASAPECNKLVEPAAHSALLDGDEARSVSIYPSRPLSRLDLECDVPAVPQLPHEYRGSVGRATVHHPKLPDEGSVSAQDGGDTPTSVTKSDGSRSFWRRYGSARGSLETTITVPSVRTGSSRKQSLNSSSDTNGSRRRLRRSIRAALRRSVSLGRSKRTSVSGSETEEWFSDSTELRADSESHEPEPVWFLYGMRDAVAKTMMSCVRWPAGLFVATGRAMVNQQLKMLDVAN